MAQAVGLAHRRAAFVLDSVTVDGAEDVLVAGRQAALFPGGELVLAGRYVDNPPSEIVLKGTLAGKAKTLRIPLELTGDGSLADRAWAEIAVQQMLALYLVLGPVHGQPGQFEGQMDIY